MARYGYTLTLPTISGSYSELPVLLRAKEFPTAAIDGGATSLPNGGGSSRYYTDNAKTTQIPAEIVSFVTGSSPIIHVEVKLPSTFTGATIYVEDDTVAISQPAVTDTYGRNNTYTGWEFVSHDLVTDSTGNYTGAFTVNGNPTQVDSPYSVPNGAYEFDGAGDYISVPVGARDPLSGNQTTDPFFIQACFSTSSTNTFNRGFHVHGGVNNKHVQLGQNADGNNYYVTASNSNASNVGIIGSREITDTYELVQGVGETQDGSTSTISIFVDGTKSTTAGTTALSSGSGNTESITIGARNDAGGTYFGRISGCFWRLDKPSDDFINTMADNRDINSVTPWGTVGAWEDQDAGGGVSVTDTKTNSNTLSNIDTINLAGEFSILDKKPPQKQYQIQTQLFLLPKFQSMTQ